jgi:hypothetical protein
LKKLLTSAPILRIADPNAYFIVCTDAYKEELGRVLSQNGFIIYYESRKLKEHEKNYATDDLELVVVSDISCLRIRRTHVCSLHEKHPSITRENPVFFSSKSSERKKFRHQRPRSIHRSGSMVIGFSGPTSCPGFSKGKRHGSKQIWTVRSNWDRWHLVSISGIRVSGSGCPSFLAF